MSKTFLGIIILAIVLLFSSPMLVKAETLLDHTAARNLTADAYKNIQVLCGTHYKIAVPKYETLNGKSKSLCLNTTPTQFKMQ